MGRRWGGIILGAVVLVVSGPDMVRAQQSTVDLSGYRRDCGVIVERDQNTLRVHWRASTFGEQQGQLTLNLDPDRPLIGLMGLSPSEGIRDADPMTFLLVGSRKAPKGRPPGMSEFNVFFDTPTRRPFQSYRSRLDRKSVRVTSRGHRATIEVGELTVGPFVGRLAFTVYDGAPLVHVETIIKTKEERRAILYDAGLTFAGKHPVQFAWTDTEGRFEQDHAKPETKDRAIAVRNRLLVASDAEMSIACFPPPHQFFSPRDLTENLHTVWFGKGHRGLDDRFGFGIRQSETGGGSFVPWFNAPPGTEQRLGVFYLISPGGPEDAIRDVLKYTHGDRFVELPGYTTFTTHWHMAITMAAMKEKERGGERSIPDFVRMFRELGVKIVHLAEFHGDGHPHDPGPVRLAELRAMFDECRRLSDDSLLFLPGEEANVPLGSSDGGLHPGHWVYLFPRPVYWTMKRAKGQPFVEDLQPFGKVYHVGDGDDFQRLLDREHGLAWTSHPRIKGSSWTPDRFRHEDFYRSDHWLGAAWKAMPADLSLDRLGRRALDLLDDMANWGPRKYLPGEVDVFKIDHTHELYGHMNINYLRLKGDALPRFDQGWQPVLDTLRAGRFFVSTGEVLIPRFTVNGRESGAEVKFASGETPELVFELSWTFPMQFAEVISGDGSKVYRERIDLSDTGPFDHRTIRIQPHLDGRKWVRVEAWDVATNGALTQPVWLETTRGASPSSR